jgi:3-deoxy-7-phosphoheptulonate synthase
MLIVMDRTATDAMVTKVCEEVEKMGLKAHPMSGSIRIAIGVTGNDYAIDADRIASLPGVNDIVHVTPPYRLAGRNGRPDNTLVKIGDVSVGGPEFTVIAGPCSVETEEQCFTIAEQVAEAGAKIFRGGAFKPRTSPYSFQGLGEEALEVLVEVRKRYGLKIVTEAIDTDTVDMVADHADIIQIGARSMQNYTLLKKAGQTGKPILLKRGRSAMLHELLLAAEYIMTEGNDQIILCERGVRTFANHTRNTLDLSAVPFVKANSHLPIIVDPSHGTGRRDQIVPLSRAALAVGADGLMVEVHHRPHEALSDGVQAITPETFADLMKQLRRMAGSLDRILS